jgi:hypothetical protein
MKKEKDKSSEMKNKDENNIFYMNSKPQRVQALLLELS